MPLETCGTVIGTEHGQVIVRVEAETCKQCSGNCIKFRFPGRLHAKGQFDVGTKVRVIADARHLTLASLLVFGLPLIAITVTALVFQSPLILLVVFVSSLLFVYLNTRAASFKRLLNSRAEIL